MGKVVGTDAPLILPSDDVRTNKAMQPVHKCNLINRRNVVPLRPNTWSTNATDYNVNVLLTAQ